MGFVIGMDEAGYGPNLGPLVLTATVWEVPDRPKKLDFWKTFAAIAQREIAKKEKATKEKAKPKKNGHGAQAALPAEPSDLPPADDRLHIADSKAVYCPAIGLGPLERGALAAFGVASRVPSDFDQLLDDVWGQEATEPAPFASGVRGRDLWFAEDIGLPLPLCQEARTAAHAAEKWRTVCEATGVRLRAIRSDVVAPRRWNVATRETDNKATVLSRLHLQLLRRVWDPETAERTTVIADKHGGRNYYAQLLAECVGDRMVLCRGESRDSSVYKVGSTEIRFEAKAERHFPVALASMVSKYVRELAMELFNRFWQTHLPELKRTHGYPRDSHRFRRDVAEVQSRLAIPDDVLWRER